MTDHPITPPPELVQKWRHKWTEGHGEFGVYLATQAARWGADQELEACRQWTAQRTVQWSDGTWPADALCAARRPKPPSLKEQAISDLQSLAADLRSHGLGCNTDTIRRALEALSDD